MCKKIITKHFIKKANKIGSLDGPEITEDIIGFEEATLLFVRKGSEVTEKNKRN